jgi:HAD superfamily hydrolase (TIGR01549 family)
MTNNNSNDQVLKDVEFNSLKGVLIDIDNTIYPYLPNHINALKASYQFYKESFGSLDLSYEEFSDEYRCARNRVTEQYANTGACRSRLLAFHLLSCKFKLPKPYIAARDLEKKYWDQFIDGMEIFPYIYQFLKKCKSRNLIISAVTDMQFQIQVRKLEKLNLIKYIDYLITSEEAGTEKPNKDIFELALSIMGLNADEVIMIGDSIEKDIAGANNVGIKPIYLPN